MLPQRGIPKYPMERCSDGFGLPVRDELHIFLVPQRWVGDGSPRADHRQMVRGEGGE
jgi:hypothetical protein